MKLEVNWSKFGRSLRSAFRFVVPYAILAVIIVAAKIALIPDWSQPIDWQYIGILFFPTGFGILVLAAAIIPLYFAALGAQWLFFKTIYRARHIDPLRKIMRALPPSS